MQALCFMHLVTYYASIIGRGLVTNEQDLQIHLSYFSKELKLMSSLYDEATFSLNFCLQKARGKSHYIHLSSYSVSKFLQFQVKMQMIVAPMTIEYLLESNICQCLVSGYYIINYIYPMAMFPWLLVGAMMRLTLYGYFHFHCSIQAQINLQCCCFSYLHKYVNLL